MVEDLISDLEWTSLRTALYLSPLSSPPSHYIPGLPHLLHLYDPDPVPGEIPGGLQPPPQGKDQIKSSGFQPLINRLSIIYQCVRYKRTKIKLLG